VPESTAAPALPSAAPTLSVEPRPAHAPEPIELVDAPVPPRIELEWEGQPDAANPREEDHALALFQEDEWNRALPCPGEGRAENQPPSPNRHRCAYRHAASMRISGTLLWLGAVRVQHEHDGMYGIQDEIVVLAPHTRGARVLHTLRQWGEEVVDCFTELLQRRQIVVDLDGDGGAELCVESVHERGVGLFYVMDLEQQKKPWVPIARERVIEAYRLDRSALRLTRVKELDARCPRTGYAPFVTTPSVGDAISGRRAVQGDPPLAACPRGPVKACFGLDAECPPRSP
jgi:hypothetical protein